MYCFYLLRAVFFPWLLAWQLLRSLSLLPVCLLDLSFSSCLSSSGGRPFWRGRRPASWRFVDSGCSTSFPEASGPKQQLPVSCRLRHQCRKLSETSQGPAAVSPAGGPGRKDTLREVGHMEEETNKGGDGAWERREVLDVNLIYVFPFTL